MDQFRFEIDTQNEDEFLVAQQGLVEVFRDWCRAAGEAEADTSVVRAMLEYKWDAEDGALLYWTSVDVEDFLLNWLPDNPSAGVDSPAGAAGTVRAFSHFLLAGDLIVAVECDDIEDRLDGLEDDGLLARAPTPVPGAGQERGAGVDPDRHTGSEDVDAVGLSMQIDLTDLSGAEALLTSCADLPPDMAVHVLAEWCAEHDPGTASVEVAEVLRGGGDPLERSLGFLCLDLLGPRAAAGVRMLLERPDLAAAARVWLVAHGAESAASLEDGDVPEAFVDVLAMRLAIGNAPEVLTELAGTCASDDLIVLVERCAVVDHPNTADVLEAFVHHHPERGVSEASARALRSVRGDVVV